MFHDALVPFAERRIIKMTLHEKWEHIDHRLRMLDAADQEEEAGLLSEAYERLICAYQEARGINDELEELLKNALMN